MKRNNEILDSPEKDPMTHLSSCFPTACRSNAKSRVFQCVSARKSNPPGSQWLNFPRNPRNYQDPVGVKQTIVKFTLFPNKAMFGNSFISVSSKTSCKIGIDNFWRPCSSSHCCFPRNFLDVQENQIFLLEEDIEEAFPVLFCVVL